MHNLNAHIPDEDIVPTRTLITEDMPTTQPLMPGDQIHFLKSGLTFHYKEGDHGGEISQRAQTVTVTAEMIRASRDVNGNSWLDTLLDDEDAQEQRWGDVYVRRGPAPIGLTSWEPDTIEEELLREVRLVEAWSQPEGDAQDKALAAVRREFGRKKTSQTLSKFGFSK